MSKEYDGDVDPHLVRDLWTRRRVNLSMFGEQDPAFGDALDFYETPQWAFDAIVPHIPEARHRGWDVLEPAAGRGALVRAIEETLLPRSVTAIELSPVRFAELQDNHPACRCIHGDFLSLSGEPVSENQLVIMNPPYTAPRKTIGLEFVERAIQIATPSLGAVVALLPLDFATGVERCERVHDRHTCSVYPLRRRPHFGGPHSGARPFAWFVWDLLMPKREWMVVG